MKTFIILLLCAIALSSISAQTDKHGNPVYNNVLISDEKYDDFELSCSYYTIADNISNKKSSVYVSDSPTPAEYLKFSRDLPSYFFIVHEGTKAIALIMLLQKNEGNKTSMSYNILNPSNGQSTEIPCGVWGDITEKRAEELLALKVDSFSGITDLPNNGRGLMYAGVVYRIQPYDRLKAEVIEIATQLVNPPRESDIEQYIKKETIGGKLDFNKALEDSEQELFLYDGVAYNKKDFAVYLWGKKVKELGVSSSGKAEKLWEEIHKTTLSDSEKKALVKGFTSE